MKVSAKAKEPFIFKDNELCLTIGCKNGGRKLLLKTVIKVEEDEDLHIGWYVFIVNVYLIILLQTMCTWIRRIVNGDVDRIENSKESNSKSVVKH